MFHVWGKHHVYVSIIIHLVQVPPFDNARHYDSATGVGCYNHKIEEFPFRNALFQQFLGTYSI